MNCITVWILCMILSWNVEKKFVFLNDPFKGFAALVRFQRSRRLLGVCYIVVKVSIYCMGVISLLVVYIVYIVYIYIF